MKKIMLMLMLIVSVMSFGADLGGGWEKRKFEDVNKIEKSADTWNNGRDRLTFKTTSSQGAETVESYSVFLRTGVIRKGFNKEDPKISVKDSSGKFVDIKIIPKGNGFCYIHADDLDKFLSTIVDQKKISLRYLDGVEDEKTIEFAPTKTLREQWEWLIKR